MVKRVKAFIDSTKLFETEDKLLLAISGGVDSMVLLHIMNQLPYKFEVAHVNYDLRGVDSQKDEELVRAVCMDLKVRLHVRKVGPQEWQDGHSIQMAARSIRYRWFETLMQDHQLQYIVTAHHANDNFETSLFNLVRGTGIQGLRGMRTATEKIRRPLLDLTKQELVDYASKEKISWREDESNNTDKYQRNKIRHRVIPVLHEINPSLISTFKHSRRRFLGLEELLNLEVKKLRDTKIQVNNGLTIVNLDWLEDDDRSFVLLTELLKPFQFHLLEVENIIRAKKQPGTTFYSEKYCASVDRGQLLISETGELKLRPLLLQGLGKFKIEGGELDISLERVDYEISSHSNVAMFDAAKMNFPLVLRPWLPGDKLQPLGMTGSKKVSDLLIDAKVPLALKKRVLVLTSGEDLCWLVGLRVSHKFRITDQTGQVLRIEYRPQ